MRALNMLRLTWQLLLFITFVAQANLRINEVQSSNFSSHEEPTGQFNDWVELHNIGSSTINLAGYMLSDNINRPDKWIFTGGSIAPGQYLLVYASGLGLTAGPLHTTFRLAADGEVVVLSDRIGQLIDSVTLGAIPTDFSWGRFPDASGPWFLHDRPTPNGANRASVARSLASEPRFSIPGGMYRSTQESTGAMEANPLDHNHSSNNAYHHANSSVTPGTGSSFFVSSGGYTHVQYFLATPDGGDYAGYEMFLTGVSLAGAQRCQLRATIPAGKRFDIGFHQTDLNGRARYRVFVTGTGVENDTYEIPLTDPAGVLNLNTLQSFRLRAADPGDLEVKIYNIRFFTEANAGGPVRVSLTADAGDQIRFTTNGSEPTENSTLYSTPFSLERTTRIRARSFSDSKLPSGTVSHTYFVNETFPIAVVSIQMRESDLWDPNNGIYVMGPNASGATPHYGANFWQDWERPINFEFFEANGVQAISQRAGTKIFGGWSRANARKSLAIFSRNVYGKVGFDYPFFSSRPHTSYRNLVLRASGNDWDQGLIRDGVMTGLVDKANIELQAWRPIIVFVNGENFGMHFLREKTNEHMVANRYGIEEPSQIDILELRGTVVHGDSSHYMAMLKYMEDNDISQPQHFDWIKQQMDVANFAAYYASQIYFANTDWPGNNKKYWRYRAPGNRWRWLLYDTDFGFDIWSGSKNNAVHSNNLAWVLNTNEVASDQANSPRATWLFRTMIQNREFRDLFITTMADFLNTYFLSSVVRSHIDSLRGMVLPGLDLHFQATRFIGGHNRYVFDDNITAMRNFARDRPANVREHFRSRFDLTETTLSITTVGTGRVKLTSHAFVQGQWSGTYFRDVPVTLTATPINGHPFVGWSGAVTSNNPVITLPMSQATSVTATFGVDPNFRAPVPPSPVIIPEPVVPISEPVVFTGKQPGGVPSLHLAAHNLEINLPYAGGFVLTVHDATGREVMRHQAWAGVGVHSIALPPNSKGIYFARLRTARGGQAQIALSVY